MLLFSEYLRELLQVKQMSVSTLARLSGVERTLLSRTLSGQRVLPYHTLDELIYHLKLTPEEEERLRSYYDAQFEKEGVRRSREIINKLFENLARLDFIAQAFEEPRLLMRLEQYAGERMIFSGEMTVQFLLRMAIADEMAHPNASLELTALPSDTFLMSELIHRYLDDQMAMEVHHIICFDASGRESDINLHNLEYFCRIFPICLLSMQQYHPYYYYDTDVGTHYINPFPYFLATHQCVVCLSKDGKDAMLLRSPAAVTHYRRHFQTLVDKCYSLVQYTTDPLELIGLYQRCTDPDGFYMVMDQPCFGRFYSENFVKSHLRQGLEKFDQILHAAQERFSLLGRVAEFYTVFSEKGLLRFLVDGTLDDYPVELVTPFPKEERIRLVRELAAAVQSQDVSVGILKEDVFPGYLAMCTTKERGIGFFTTRQFPLSDGICSVWIRERNLCRAFHGWLKHLPGSSLTLTAKETIEILKKAEK